MRPGLLAITTGWLAGWSLVSFMQFGRDKARARAGRARVPEITLLGTALIGGAVGAKLGQHLFRHKTRKQPFARQLNAVLAVNLAAGLSVLLLGLG